MKRSRAATVGRAMLPVVLWGIAFAMACRLDAVMTPLRPPDMSIMERVFGATRVAIGSHFYIEADRYFHLGVGHTHTRRYEGAFHRWAEAIQPTGHAHTHDHEVNEILPWLRMATAMDPHNVEAYLNAAYWISGEGGRRDLAEIVFSEAQRCNPDDYRIFQEKGLFYVREKEDQKAIHALDMALRLWPSRQDPKDEQTRLDLAQVLTIRAFLHDMLGEKEQALALFKKASSMFPENRGLAKRVQILEKGGDSETAARKTWDSFFPRSQICSREGHAHDRDDGHDHEHEHDDEHEHGCGLQE